MKVVLLGSGNVATHLGQALKSAGHQILQVWSRTFENAQQLAVSLDASPISDLESLSEEAEIYIISVSDNAIPAVCAQFPFQDKLIVHTSGTTGLDVFDGHLNRCGVFYPLQTFSKQRAVDFQKVPMLIEGSSTNVTGDLLALAKSLSHKAVILNSEQRKALHVAAVFACNFSNHLYSIASEILSQNKMDFDLIRPLIEETAAKAQTFNPQEVQTGPAVRNDQLTLAKHFEFLKDQPELRKIYQLMSQHIINFYQKS